MTRNESEPDILITAANVDLTNCDREQIHIPNLIQPHGVLIIADEKTLKIIQVSENSKELLKLERQLLLDTPLEDLLGSVVFNTVQNCINRDFEAINPLYVVLERQPFSLVINAYKGYLFLEFEPVVTASRNSFFDFYNMTRKVIDEMQLTQDTDQLSEVIVRNIRQLTGFDRVMVYRFADDRSGHVIAEDKQDFLEPYQGLHYPATDVPKPARELYCLNYIRMIVDVNSENVAMPPHPETGEPFDLSFADLRSVSPLHVDYLQNMGVRASMSISLLHEQKLWGLVACHHYSEPMRVPYEVRSACEFLGKVMSLNLVAKMEKEDFKYKMLLKEKLSGLLEVLTHATDLGESLRHQMPMLQGLVAAGGIAIYLGKELTVHGSTPTEVEIYDLIHWLQEHEQDDDLFYTDNLAAVYPPAKSYKAIASGIMALYLSRVEGSCILWFRPEVIQSVTWAGNPNKQVTLEADGSLTLTPRKSFALWTESVKGHSKAWQQCEIQQAMELRNLLVDLIFKKSNELLALNVELQRSNEELDSFAYIASHDLKEPLRGIYNYSYLLLDEYEEILEGEGSRKLQTLMTLTKRMEKLIDTLLHFSRLGRQHLALQTIDLKELILKDIQSILQVSKQEAYQIQIANDIPPFKADRTLVSEVFMNLITNALKYNISPNKLVIVGSLQDAQHSTQTVYYVRDNGIGIKPQYKETIFRIFKRLHGQQKFGGGTGAGLTIVKKIIERHGGKIWLESEPGKGTTFYFTFSPEIA